VTRHVGFADRVCLVLFGQAGIFFLHLTHVVRVMYLESTTIAITHTASSLLQGLVPVDLALETH
jgi:hypothetical protein